MDDDESDLGTPFEIPDLWGISKLHANIRAQDSVLFSQLQLDDIDEALPNVVQQLQNTKDDFFSIPDLNINTEKDATAPNETAEFHAGSNTTDGGNPAEPDVWAMADDVPISTATYQSWDGFENAKLQASQAHYITEAGASVFDAALATRECFLRIDNAEHLVLESKIYINSLLALGLGRESVLFAWDVSKECFCFTRPETRVSGYTGDSLDKAVILFMGCGNITRALRKFVDKSYVGNTAPGRIALAEAVSTLLATVQSHLTSRTSMHNSILQLQALFQPAHSILVCFHRVVTNVAATRSDESMLSTIFQEVQLLEDRTDSLKAILLVILSRVSRPWLEFSGEWLGLQRETGLPITKDGDGKSFVRVENREWVDEQGLEISEPDFVLDIDRVPIFLAPEDARAMFEVGRSLRFLRDHHSNHPLARANIIASANPPALEWKFSWQEIMQVEEKALQYEKDLVTAIQQYSHANGNSFKILRHESNSSDNTFEMDFFGKPEEDMQAHVLASINLFNQPLKSERRSDQLSLELNAYLTSKDDSCQHNSPAFSAPLSLAHLLSFNPIISAQARVVNGTCMRMFFNSHNLRQHLNLQRSFHLLGNGVFSSRLSHALFDPELESAERQKGIARSGGMMGLRLGGRDTWPPASSELRLALMGILTDSYVSNKATGAETLLDENSLPGDLSFAIRDMTEEEIEKCINPDSVEALDFLRLSYKPPPPIEAIITPMILFKYDQLFKLLLRVIRMLYVCSTLFRDATDRTSYWQGIDYVAQRFRIEAHHFISSLSGYFFDTGIESTWRRFDRKLDQIEERIDDDDDNYVLGQNEGLDKLRDYHEKVLDRIMFALLLRKRQQPVMKLLEEIFTLILQFSKHSRQRALGLKRKFGADDEVREMYLKYRKKVGVFITVCRGLSEKKGYGEKRSLDSKVAGPSGLFDGDDLVEENTVAQLLARLEMSNYYSGSSDV